MAQKSTYLQAPYTQDALVQTIKDGYAVVGADTIQNSDLSYVYDSDYWINKYRKTSSTNLINESEMLLAPDVDRAENTNLAGSTAITANREGFGATAYIKQNSDTNLPFSLINYIKPRYYQRDFYNIRRISGLDINSQYTYSFYARKPDGGVRNKLSVNLRRSGTSTYTTDLFEVNNNWQRFTKTFTPATASVDLMMGGFSTWTQGENLVPYSEYMQNWSHQAGIVTDYYNYDPPLTVTHFRATRLSNSSTSTLAYSFYPCSTGKSIANKTFTFSVYAKLLSGAPKLVLSDGGSDSTETLGLSTVIDTVGEWKRYSLTYTFKPTSTSQVINVHVGLKNGDSVIVWGFSLEESGEAGSYIPNHGTALVSPPFIGDIEIAGLQVEKSPTSTPYSPVTSWCYLPYSSPINVDRTLNDEAMAIKVFIPGGVISHMYNVNDSDNIGYNGCVGNICSSSSSIYTPSNKNFYIYEQNSHSWITTNDAVSSSNWAMSSGQPNNTLAYASDALKMPTRTFGSSPNHGSISGSMLISFAPPKALPLGSGSYRLKFSIMGSLFKVSDRAVDFGLPAGKVRSVVVNLKTPGNGKRKQLNYIFVDNNSTGNTVVHFVPNLLHIPSQGNAEASQPLVPAISDKVPYNAFVRASEVGAYPQDVIGIKTSQFRDSVTLSRNTDVFNFTQGSSEGFVHAINVNSNFVFHMGAFDSTNQPIEEDDGSKVSRTFILSPTIGSYDYNIMNNSYIFDNYSVQTSNYMSNAWCTDVTDTLLNPPLEVYGDSTNNTGQLFPVYAGNDNINGSSNRGHLKNLYICHNNAFGGSIGDIYIAKDNSRYFCFNKRTMYSSNTSNFGIYAFFVKV